MKRTMRILAVILMMAIKILKKILGEQSGFFRHNGGIQQIQHHLFVDAMHRVSTCTNFHLSIFSSQFPPSPSRVQGETHNSAEYKQQHRTLLVAEGGYENRKEDNDAGGHLERLPPESHESDELQGRGGN